MSSTQVQDLRITLPQHCRSLKIHHRLSGSFLLFFLKAGLSFTMKSKSAGIAGVSHPYLAKHVFQVCLLMCYLTIIKLIIGIFFHVHHVCSWYPQGPEEHWILSNWSCEQLRSTCVHVRNLKFSLPYAVSSVSFKIKGFLFCFLLTADTIIRPPVFNFQVNFFVGPISGYQK